MLSVCNRLFILALALGTAGLAAGCGGGGNGPKLGRVAGKVIFDGQPLPDATVTFTPIAEGASLSLGKTDGEGTYELYFARDTKGAFLGEHAVRISSFGASGEACERLIVPEKVPSRYNLKSELRAKVEPGANKLDFDLKSGGEVVQPAS